MLYNIIIQILAHYQFHPKLTGQRMSADQTVDRVQIDLDGFGTRVELFIRRSDLYVLGYVGSSKSFVINENPSPDINATSLGFACDYMSLGWNRTATPRRTFTEGNIISALYAAEAGSKLGKSQFINWALLMEATRFLDVSANIINGLEIRKEQLDWGNQAKEGNARIVKSSMNYIMADE